MYDRFTSPLIKPNISNLSNKNIYSILLLEWIHCDGSCGYIANELQMLIFKRILQVHLLVAGELQICSAAGGGFIVKPLLIANCPCSIKLLSLDEMILQ